MAPTAPIRVAFQGERGAFSEEAAVKLLGEAIQVVPRPTFDALFSAVSEQAADYALAPLENTLAGSVHRTHDLLVGSGLSIQAEVVLPIHHMLIGLPGATFEQLGTVESHPVALAQCERFFAQHPNLKRVAVEDTAGAVRTLMQQQDQRRAAIAGRRAAAVYGAQILREHLEDHSENYTRFVLLGRDATPRPGADKLSVVVKLAHVPGALSKALQVFAGRGLNLTKIESRPLVGQPFQYQFYLDVEARVGATQAGEALDELRRYTDEVRVLGWYFSTQALGGRVFDPRTTAPP